MSGSASRHVGHKEALIRALMETPGHTAPELRRGVEARAAALSGRPTPVAELPVVPAALTAYTDKVALHAYRVTDADVAALHGAGYSEDAIFEITVSAAVGAGLARLERGLAALRGSA